jgi:hypothetical protein
MSNANQQTTKTMNNTQLTDTQLNYKADTIALELLATDSSHHSFESIEADYDSVVCELINRGLWNV